MKTNIKDQSLFLEGVGNVYLKLSRKAKHTRIMINSDSKIIVIKPSHLRLDNVIKFINSKKQWIKKTKNKISKRKILKLDLSDSELTNFWYNTEQTMLQLSNEFDLDYHKLIFKTLKSMWGSCSYDNVICINNLIYYLPMHLQDYVILHELTHTKIKNHSKIFWQELEKICPNAKIKRKELRDNYALE